MKLQLTLLLLMMLICNGCKQITNLTKPKPVTIDGLGVLSALKNKKLTEEQLLKVVETVDNLNRVNAEDAQAMLDIYRQHPI